MDTKRPPRSDMSNAVCWLRQHDFVAECVQKTVDRYIIEDTLAGQGWIALMSLRVQQQHRHIIVCKRLTHFTNLIPVRLLCRKTGVCNVDKLSHFSNPYCTLS